jgi:hypothetical protein
LFANPEYCNREEVAAGLRNKIPADRQNNEARSIGSAASRRRLGTNCSTLLSRQNRPVKAPGLSISYDIVTQQYGGVIEVDSRVGEFTEFTIRLPRGAVGDPV